MFQGLRFLKKEIELNLSHRQGKRVGCEEKYNELRDGGMREYLLLSVFEHSLELDCRSVSGKWCGKGLLERTVEL